MTREIATREYQQTEDPQICNRVASVFNEIPNYCVIPYEEDCISSVTMTVAERFA